MERQFGFYWVKFKGTWQIALYCPWRNMASGEVITDVWTLNEDCYNEYKDSNFEQIHEQLIPFPADLPQNEKPEF